MQSSQDPVADVFDAYVPDGVRRGEVDRGDRVLRWVEAGTGTPTVVLESGAASNALTWLAVFAALSADHRVIAYDRAGYGCSDPAPLAADGQLADLIAVLEAAGPSPAVLVGHSWGGLLAQHAAWLRPDLIGGLLLVDPSDEGIWLDVLTADELRAMGEHTDPTRPASEDARAADLFTDADEISRDIAGRDPQLLELVTRASRSYLATDEQIRVHLDEPPMIVDGLDGMVRLRTEASWPPLPMVVLTATKERPARFTEPVVALHEEVAVAAAGRHVVVRDSGHYIQVDRPDLVIEQVREVCFANSDWT